jgi:hypothetical protein
LRLAAGRHAGSNRSHPRQVDFWSATDTAPHCSVTGVLAAFSLVKLASKPPANPCRPDFVDEAGTQTGFALVNPSAQDAAVTLTLRDAAGVALSERRIGLGPRQHLARYVYELFSYRPSLSVGARRSRRLRSDSEPNVSRCRWRRGRIPRPRLSIQRLFQ